MSHSNVTAAQAIDAATVDDFARAFDKAAPADLSFHGAMVDPTQIGRDFHKECKVDVAEAARSATERTR